MATIPVASSSESQNAAKRKTLQLRDRSTEFCNIFLPAGIP